MLDSFTNIAKYCDERALIAITRTCRILASKQDNEGLSRNAIWCAAMLTRFPNKKYLPFYSDEVNYFVAKSNELAMVIAQNGGWSSVFEWDSIIGDIIDYYECDGRYCDRNYLVKFVPEERFLVINCWYEVEKQTSSYGEAKNISCDLVNNIGNVIVIDLMCNDIKFLRHKGEWISCSYYHKGYRYSDELDISQSIESEGTDESVSEDVAEDDSEDSAGSGSEDVAEDDNGDSAESCSENSAKE